MNGQRPAAQACPLMCFDPEGVVLYEYTHIDRSSYGVRKTPPIPFQKWDPHAAWAMLVI